MSGVATEIDRGVALPALTYTVAGLDATVPLFARVIVTTPPVAVVAVAGIVAVKAEGPDAVPIDVVIGDTVVPGLVIVTDTCTDCHGVWSERDEYRLDGEQLLLRVAESAYGSLESCPVVLKH